LSSASLLSERRRKRRESHNAVERRRRDNINDRIAELASLLPDVLLEPAQGSQSNNGETRADPNTDTSSPIEMSSSPKAASLASGFTLNSPPVTSQQLSQHVAVNMPNKGVILGKSIEYIRYLQQVGRCTPLDRLPVKSVLPSLPSSRQHRIASSKRGWQGSMKRPLEHFPKQPQSDR
jgi:Helix-loop-helix DNA-binding domain